MTQTGTHVVPAEGIDDLTLQAPTKIIYTGLVASVGLTPDGSKCQMATTVTRKGGSVLEIGADGEPGATVTLAPALAEDGPIYFDASNVPKPASTDTTDGGGVLFGNVLPGEYVMSGHKNGVELGDVKVKCLPGVLVNASPPRGMNVL